MKEIGKVYLIKNKINGKVYIGQTIQSLKRRFAQHKYSALTKKKKTPLYSSIRKYGIDNFEITLLEDNIKPEELNDIEASYILKYSSVEEGYNLKYRETKVAYNRFDIKDIIKRYKNKDTLKEISKDYNADKRTISSMLKENGIKIRDWNKEQSEDITKEQLEEMLLVKKMSLSKMAKEIGLSRQAVTNWVDKFGIPR
jgi:group I intron endonuclease